MSSDRDAWELPDAIFGTDSGKEAELRGEISHPAIYSGPEPLFSAARDKYERYDPSLCQQS